MCVGVSVCVSEGLVTLYINNTLLFIYNDGVLFIDMMLHHILNYSQIQPFQINSGTSLHTYLF